MDLEWQLDNPVIALEKYFEDVKLFAPKKETNDRLETELSSKKRELGFQREELEQLKEKLQSMGIYVQDDIASMIKTVQKRVDQKISTEQERFDLEKDQLLVQKEKDITENDTWLEECIQKIFGNNDNASQKMTESEKRILEFEVKRRKFIIISNEKINEYQDAITQEKLDCETMVGQWKQEQDVIYNQFEPDVSKYTAIIDEINKKYEPEIQQYRNIINEKTAVRDEEVGELEAEKERGLQVASNEIANYQRDYESIAKQYGKRIRWAESHNKPVAGIMNERDSRLRAINTQITQIDNRANREAAGIDKKIASVSGKYGKQIDRAEAKRDIVIDKRDDEARPSVQILNGLTEDRDGQISVFQMQIDERESACREKIGKLGKSIEDEYHAQKQHNSQVDQQIAEYAMSSDNCFSDVLDEASAPFRALEKNHNTWMELLAKIKKKKMETAYVAEREKQKNMLMSKGYRELQEEVAEAERFRNTISIFSEYNNIFLIAGGVVFALGMFVMIVLGAILKISVGFLGFIGVAAGAALVVATIMKTKKEFSMICKYMSLMVDYRGFPGLSAYTSQVTRERELKKMKQLGSKLYEVHYGKAEAQNIHDAKEKDILSDYERNLKLMQKEFENLRNQLERECNDEIRKIKKDASEGEDRFKREKEETQKGIQNLTGKIARLDKKIQELEAQISENTDFMEAFESNYQQLEKNLQDSNWKASMEYTHGKLQNALFVIPENNAADSCGHKKIYKLQHNKTPLVITYDISDMEESGGSHIEVGRRIHNLLEELMYAVYRMNSHETYAQFIVDGAVCTNDFKNTRYKNAFNIGEVVVKIEDIRGRIKGFLSQREQLAEKGIRMDEINESKFQTQDRPEVYNILYIIYNPGERKSRLEDEIRTLIPDCDKYGFLPVFICERETWDQEIQEKESMYKEIRSMLSNPVIVYDGTGYTAVN